MPADIEIAAEELDRASRRWEEAAERWRTASHRVPQASLAPGAWAPDLPVTARRFADAHQECVHEVRLRLLAGVDALRETAGALRGQARSYLALDAESARALQVLGQQVLGQQVLGQQVLGQQVLGQPAREEREEWAEWAGPADAR